MGLGAGFVVRFEPSPPSRPEERHTAVRRGPRAQSSRPPRYRAPSLDPARPSFKVAGDVDFLARGSNVLGTESEFDVLLAEDISHLETGNIRQARCRPEGYLATFVQRDRRREPIVGMLFEVLAEDVPYRVALVFEDPVWIAPSIRSVRSSGMVAVVRDMASFDR